MPWSALADALLVLHGLFIVWVVFGGLAVWARPLWAWAHLPCAAWGAWIEFSGGLCPLTPIEQRWREAAGEAGYRGSFVEHYLTVVIYPEGLTRDVQIALGFAVVAINVTLYGAAWRRAARRRRAG